jgi:hypothetical protein
MESSMKFTGARESDLTSRGDQASDCIGCVAGKYLDTVGSDEATDCIDCALGRRVDVPRVAPHRCASPLRLFAAPHRCGLIAFAIVRCSRATCARGRYVDVAGSGTASDCIACAAGKYANGTGGAQAFDEGRTATFARPILVCDVRRITSGVAHGST